MNPTVEHNNKALEVQTRMGPETPNPLPSTATKKITDAVRGNAMARVTRVPFGTMTQMVESLTRGNIKPPGPNPSDAELTHLLMAVGVPAHLIKQAISCARQLEASQKDVAILESDNQWRCVVKLFGAERYDNNDAEWCAVKGRPDQETSGRPMLVYHAGQNELRIRKVEPHSRSVEPCEPLEVQVLRQLGRLSFYRRNHADTVFEQPFIGGNNLDTSIRAKRKHCSRDVLRDQPSPLTDAAHDYIDEQVAIYTLSAGLRIADQLDQLHANCGIVHGDLKPANIRVSARRQELTIIDFSSSHKIGSVVGKRDLSVTARYCAPEVADGWTARPSADVFSLGCILAEEIVGESPATGIGINRHIFLAMLQHLNGTLKDELQTNFLQTALYERAREYYERLIRSAGEDLAEVLLRMVHYDADQRVQSAREASNLIMQTKLWKISSPAKRQNVTTFDAFRTRVVQGNA